MKIYAVRILDIDEKNLMKLYMLISSKRRQKIEKFKHKRDSIRTLIGEILIRSLAWKELSIKNECINFDKNEYGKPYLEGYPKFNFNISHSGDFVVCAVSDRPIGIDIEKVEYIEYKYIAKTFFTAGEFDYIVKKKLDIQLSTFYEIWTLKESYTKCCGQGLSIPLNSFSIDIDECGNVKSIAEDENNQYFLKKVNIGLHYKMAVCSLSENISSDIIVVDQNSLIMDIQQLSTIHY